MSENGFLERKNFGQKKFLHCSLKSVFSAKEKWSPVQPLVLHLLNPRERERKALEAPPLDNILPYQGRLLSGFLSQATAYKEKQSSKDKRSDF